MPNMMVTEVFKSIVQGPFGSCMTGTGSLGADDEIEVIPLANGAIDVALWGQFNVVYLTFRNIVCS